MLDDVHFLVFCTDLLSLNNFPEKVVDVGALNVFDDFARPYLGKVEQILDIELKELRASKNIGLQGAHVVN